MIGDWQAYEIGALAMSGFAGFVVWCSLAEIKSYRASLVDAASSLKIYKSRLTRIAAQEKPTSNATVRRMARIARGEE